MYLLGYGGLSLLDILCQKVIVTYIHVLVLISDPDDFRKNIERLIPQPVQSDLQPFERQARVAIASEFLVD